MVPSGQLHLFTGIAGNRGKKCAQQTIPFPVKQDRQRPAFRKNRRLKALPAYNGCWIFSTRLLAGRFGGGHQPQMNELANIKVYTE